MSIEPNALEYFRSISAELASKANRIRQLIGDSHFLSDGHHKEYLLQSVIERFLPATFVCSRGFVVRDSQLKIRSKEQDLLIIDTRMHAPLFRESGVIVTFPENVRAVISVKSTLSSNSVNDALDGLASIPDIDSTSPLWHGIFAFGADKGWDAKPQNFVNWLKKSQTSNDDSSRLTSWRCGAIACDALLFITKNQVDKREQIRAYATDLAAALFIAELTDHLATTFKAQSRGINDLLAGVDFPKIEAAS
jgi:hypothetical protein